MKRKNLLIVTGLSLAVAGMIAVASPASAFGPRGGGGFDGPGGHGGHGAGMGAERGQNLADALGIPLEELEAARAEAFGKGLEQAVENGRLTQEEADLMLAGQTLRSLIDRRALTAEALGMSVEELQAAHEAGQSLRDLLEEKGIDPQDFRDSVQALVDAAIEQAVADGVITAEQAETLKEHKGRMGKGKRGGMRGGEPGAGPGGQGRGIGNGGQGRLVLPGGDV
jgi:hypothetical protein